MVSKFGPDSGDTQFECSVGSGTAPEILRVKTGDGHVFTGSAVFSLNTWYMVGVTCDGTASANDMNIYVATMDGNYDSNYNPAVATHQGDASTLTGPIQYGASGEPSFRYWFEGDIAHGVYVDAELSSSEILAYLRHPTIMAAVFNAKYGLQFYHPLGFGSPEPDYSGNQNDGAISGTPSISAMPPTSLFTHQFGGSPIMASTIVEQEGYRWRNDDGSESVATWRKSQDTSDTVGKNVNIRLRTLLNATLDPTAASYQLEYKETDDPDSEYRKVAL